MPIAAKHPLLQVWIHPRATVRQALAVPPSPALWLLAAASGLASSLVRAQGHNLGAQAPVRFIWLLAVPIGGAVGLVEWHVLAGLLWLVGRLQDGQAGFRRLRTAVVWSGVPQLVVIASYLVSTLVVGRLAFVDADFVIATRARSLVVGMVLSAVVLLTCGVWSLVILVQGVAEAQNITAPQAMGHVLLVLLLAVVIVFVVVGIMIVL